MISINFERETVYGTYRDALVLPDNHTMTDAQIQEMMQQRVDNWLEFVNNPPQPEPEPEVN